MEETHLPTEQERVARRIEREQRRRKKRAAQRRRMLRRLLPCLLIVVLVAVVAGTVRLAKGRGHAQDSSASAEVLPAESAVQTPQEQTSDIFEAQETASTVELGEDFSSEYAVLIDLETNTILAQKGAQERINPASMTKILTVLVAAEHVTDLDDAFTITLDITDYCYRNECSVAGFENGETVSVRDLFYGTALPSGADAALALAQYVAGSEEAFVAMMNEKAEELGIGATAHFTNCIGVYDTDHYCSVYDMAVILKAAEENELCRAVLSARTYTTSATTQHPEGMVLSNWFLRRIEDKDNGSVEVVCAKTGYVTQAGSCAASYAVAQDGHEYLCVTAKTYSSWRCIYDHVALYKQFT
ncbi:MAG: D-alanyl-D-alanine carboxypeptidase [Oscillibacter sp.]|jgi:D-alanyl-D-alanine carboxypeptidase (penicillin-binding protein 5/6)|nr:D-alanyl-D-alanine carboxypeptidase [Oscillibacter sp.]